jgi:DNA polymerase-3 subunit gamma/tau
MTYQVTARKWRPQVFEEVVGQAHVTSTLRNAIAAQRVAHAYLFSGARGCGKTTTARILAKALNCLSPRDANPDNECEICREITEGRSLDVIEIDGASNRGVEEIRNLRDSVRYTATRGRYKVYIIDEVHMLTKEAFNALLKTLEEPPEHIVFVFATTEVHKVPPTILSRCQRFDFRRISVDEIKNRLRLIATAEGVTIDDDALIVIARKGDGSLRDAQSIFDQVRSFCGTTIRTADVLATLNVVDQDVYFRVTDLVQAGDRRGSIALVDEIVRGGHDLREFVAGLGEHLRNLLVVKTTGATDLLETSEQYRLKYMSAAQGFEETDLLRLIRLANELDQAIRWSVQPRFRLEAGLVQMAGMEKSVKLSELLRGIEELKKKLNSTERTGRRDAPEGAGTKNSATEREPSDVKIIGSVSAGYLATPLAVPVRPEVVAALGVSRRPTEVHGGPQQAGGTDLRTISAQEAYARWQEWIAEVSRERVLVGTVLRGSRILDVREGAVQIGCPDDYHLSSIKRHKEFLGRTLHKLTGQYVRIEAVLEREKTPAALRAADAVVPEHSAAEPPSALGLEDHPVIQALRRELGAEPVL